MSNSDLNYNSGFRDVKKKLSFREVKESLFHIGRFITGLSQRSSSKHPPPPVGRNIYLNGQSHSSHKMGLGKVYWYPWFKWSPTLHDYDSPKKDIANAEQK